MSKENPYPLGEGYEFKSNAFFVRYSNPFLSVIVSHIKEVQDSENGKLVYLEKDGVQARLYFHTSGEIFFTTDVSIEAEIKDRGLDELFIDEEEELAPDVLAFDGQLVSDPRHYPAQGDRPEVWRAALAVRDSRGKRETHTISTRSPHVAEHLMAAKRGQTLQVKGHLNQYTRDGVVNKVIALTYIAPNHSTKEIDSEVS